MFLQCRCLGIRCRWFLPINRNNDKKYLWIILEFLRIFFCQLLYDNEMYIRNITIDGFKSYATRTDVNGFDPQFNAITGLNGSGKSNILDAICFVLGISNLSQVYSEILKIIKIFTMCPLYRFELLRCRS